MECRGKLEFPLAGIRFSGTPIPPSDGSLSLMLPGLPALRMSHSPVFTRSEAGQHAEIAVEGAQTFKSRVMRHCEYLQVGFFQAALCLDYAAMDQVLLESLSNIVFESFAQGI